MIKISKYSSDSHEISFMYSMKTFIILIFFPPTCILGNYRIILHLRVNFSYVFKVASALLNLVP